MKPMLEVSIFAILSAKLYIKCLEGALNTSISTYL